SGVSNLRDITKLSRIGGKTLSLYLITTVIAITVGLVSVNTIQPGKYLSEEKRIELGERYASDANMRVTAAESLTSAGPLQVIVDIVPDNIFGAASSNTNMLQVIFFAILFGVALILTNAEKAMPVKAFFDGANEAILKVVDIVMRYAPFGVAALICALVVEINSWDLFIALGIYAINVLLSLGLMIFVIY